MIKTLNVVYVCSIGGVALKPGVIKWMGISWKWLEWSLKSVWDNNTYNNLLKSLAYVSLSIIAKNKTLVLQKNKRI